jgi:hypothetical protein
MNSVVSSGMKTAGAMLGMADLFVTTPTVCILTRYKEYVCQSRCISTCFTLLHFSSRHAFINLVKFLTCWEDFPNRCSVVYYGYYFLQYKDLLVGYIDTYTLYIYTVCCLPLFLNMILYFEKGVKYSCFRTQHKQEEESRKFKVCYITRNLMCYKSFT